MQRRFWLVLLAILPALAVSATPAAAASCGAADRHIGGKPSKGAVRATVCLLNAERRAHGLGSLRSHGKLGRGARRHGRDMVRHRYFSHTSRNGTSVAQRIKRSGYSRRHVGENLGWGGGSGSSPRKIVRSWMASPTHRALILNRVYRHVGIGIVRGTPAGVPGGTYVAHFGG
jgi:uncharacterized protein YkwD